MLSYFHENSSYNKITRLRTKISSIYIGPVGSYNNIILTFNNLK